MGSELHLALFVLAAIAYVASCAAIDGLFNRLVFREHRTLSYFSDEKQAIYRRGEWSWISLLFLVWLGVIAPTLAAAAIGGWRYVLVFWLVLLVVDWDVIFGRIVFDDWLGDTPSMKVFGVGWLHVSLGRSIAIRAVLAAGVVAALVVLGVAPSPS